jgi:2-polyprenyl-3-methyl-5-hydroxy-6-metoxy-1,4-benzoquinol methylase
MIIKHEQCPICQATTIAPLFDCVDDTVSKEKFTVMHCNTCSNRFTNNVPTQNTIGKYYKADAYVSHSESNASLINKIYLKVRNITLKNKLQLLNELTQSSQRTLLDVGAGTGAFAAYMQAQNWVVTGLEPDADAIAVAQNNNNIQLQPIANLFTLEQGKYDIITMWHVMEHVHQLHDYMAQLAKLLAPQGKLIIAVPNYTSKDAEIYGNNWAAYDVPRHLYHFSPVGMKYFAEKHGLRVKTMKPMWFDSVYVSMLSEKIKNGSPSLIKGLINGLRSNIKTLTSVDKCSSVIYIISK